MWVKVRSIAAQLAPGSLLTPLLLAGCAAAPEPFVQLSGTSGPVSWEIVDVSQTSVAGEEIRWSYTLILRSNDGAITFETLQTGSEGGGEGVHVSPFTERLESHSRLLINSSYTLQRNKMSSELFGNSLTHLEGVRLFHRLTGKDQDGRPVRIDVRFTLSAGLGAQSSGPSSRSGAQPGGSGGEPARAGPGDPAGGSLAHERIGEDATPLELALLDDVRDGSLDRHSALDAALIVSGARDRQELDALRRRFEQSVAPIVTRVSGLSTPADRAAALLGALHPARTSQAPLLREYTMDATTLIDVIETGRYNCVSATIVFTLLASRVGLDANPVLAPTHARAAVRIGSRQVPVETTEAYGFDPSEAERRKVLRRFRADVDAAPSYAEEQATDVNFLAILGAVYTNAATFRARDGNAAAAAAVARRADLFVAPAERVVLNRVRIELLNEMALESSKKGHHEEAVQALVEARRLATSEDDAQILNESLTAAGLTWLHEIEPSADDGTLLVFSDTFSAGPARDEVRSFALRLLAYRRARQEQWEDALANLQAAAPLTQNTEYRAQIARDVTNVELRYVNDLTSRDVERAWAAYQALPNRGDDAELIELRRQVGHRLVVERIRYLLDARRCEDLEEPLNLWPSFDAAANPDSVRAGCHGDRGIALWNDGHIDRAADEFRQAYRLAPAQPETKRNLLVALERLVAVDLRVGRCQNARPLIAEGLALAPADALLQRAAATCDPAP